MDITRLTTLLIELESNNLDFSLSLDKIDSKFDEFTNNEIKSAQWNESTNELINLIFSLVDDSFVHYRTCVIPKLVELDTILNVREVDEDSLQSTAEYLDRKLTAYIKASNKCEIMSAIGSTGGNIGPIKKQYALIHDKINYFYWTLARLITSIRESSILQKKEPTKIDELTDLVSEMKSKITKIEEIIEELRKTEYTQ